jgi:hypothetical protein
LRWFSFVEPKAGRREYLARPFLACLQSVAACCASDGVRPLIVGGNKEGLLVKPIMIEVNENRGSRPSAGFFVCIPA